MQRGAENEGITLKAVIPTKFSDQAVVICSTNKQGVEFWFSADLYLTKSTIKREKLNHFHFCIDTGIRLYGLRASVDSLPKDVMVDKLLKMGLTENVLNYLRFGLEAFPEGIGN